MLKNFRGDHDPREPRPGGSDGARRPGVVLERGVVQQVGGPIETCDRPANTFVASFIGSPAMNSS
ncbi:MAG: hypothetical protein R3D80_20845 [Paracoccaceae bacterium]